MCMRAQTGAALNALASSFLTTCVYSSPHRTSNFASFQRQLHFYGFRKTDHEGKAWEFSHPYFTQDQPELMSRIQRKTASDNQGRQNGGGGSSSVAANKAMGTCIEEMTGRIAALEGSVGMVLAQFSSLVDVLGGGTASSFVVGRMDTQRTSSSGT